MSIEFWILLEVLLWSPFYAWRIGGLEQSQVSATKAMSLGSDQIGIHGPLNLNSTFSFYPLPRLVAGRWGRGKDKREQRGSVWWPSAKPSLQVLKLRHHFLATEFWQVFTLSCTCFLMLIPKQRLARSRRFVSICPIEEGGHNDQKAHVH